MEFSESDIAAFEEMARSSVEPLALDRFSDEEEAITFVNWCLAGSYDDEGIQQWWDRPRSQLEGQTPRDAWGSAPERVIGLAGWLVNPSLEDRPE